MKFRDADGAKYPASDVVVVPEISETYVVETGGFFVPCADMTRTYRLKSDEREVCPVQDSKEGRCVDGGSKAH